MQARLVEAPDPGEQLPGPGDRLLLEVIAEGPVAEHLEEGVVIGVVADVVEVVVLSAGADALLRVDDAAVLGRLGAEEVGLELVHAGVGEEQRRVVVRDDRRAGHERVAVLLAKEVDEVLADLGGGSGHDAAFLRCRPENVQAGHSTRRAAEMKAADGGAGASLCQAAAQQELRPPVACGAA